MPISPTDPKVLACARCPNDTRNPTVVITASGLCAICQAYTDNYDRAHLAREFEFVTSLVGRRTGRWDAMVGLSGGKDSTAALVRTIELGFRPLAFTFNTGYYPPHITSRAADIAKQVGVDHEVISLRGYIRPSDVASFALTADLFDAPETEATRQTFRRQYLLNRERYSVRHPEAMPYVRTCQLCRRLVVRAYHREATRRGVRVVLLGTNEWVGLSQQPHSRRYRFSAVRALRPDPTAEPVYVVHLPFLLHTTLDDTASVLQRINWRAPDGEDLVEANANSCLLSRAAEAKATRLLGFHPDTTRLAREVTAGFLTRDRAMAALSTVHDYPLTVREVLSRAEILP